jgi:glutamyl-Q tRNA(Asp) synthetase
MRYIGRFAPSPTGPLHFGSLIAAVASYCDARSHHGTWLLRMEDVDKTREMQGAADNILQTLMTFGFQWDGEVIVQSKRDAVYDNALVKLEQLGLVYPCTCSRKEIADSMPARGIEGVIYPRTCLQQAPTANKPAAYRVKVDANTIRFTDRIQGEITQNLARDIGDFILKRADGLFAYQLAVVADDAEQGVTHIVRGADLLDSTPRQIYLQKLLGYTTPDYAHIPVAANANGEKLSKQTLASAVGQHPREALYNALHFLGQHPPPHLRTANLHTIWEWAFTHWSLDRIPRERSVCANG